MGEITAHVAITCALDFLTLSSKIKKWQLLSSKIKNLTAFFVLLKNEMEKNSSNLIFKIKICEK